MTKEELKTEVMRWTPALFSMGKECTDKTLEAQKAIVDMLEYQPQGDSISRKEALAFPFANGKYDHKHANEHFILGCESYKEWLEQLPPAEPQEWISVKDRLPEEHKAEEEAEERYLVTYTYTDCKENHVRIGVDLYRDGKWWYHSEEYEHVIAWMPLPSPYKGE